MARFLGQHTCRVCVLQNCSCCALYTAHGPSFLACRGCSINACLCMYMTDEVFDYRHSMQSQHVPHWIEMVPWIGSSVTHCHGAAVAVQESVATTVLVFIMFQCPMLVWMSRNRQSLYALS